MRRKILTLAFIALMMIGAFWIVPSAPLKGSVITEDESTSQALERLFEEIVPESASIPSDVAPVYPADYDIGKVLGDRVNQYKLNYEPWRSKAAIHAIAYHEPTGFLALGGGYLYDNEVHIFRLNVETGDFDKVWDTGDQIIQGDVMSLDFGDTDLNDFIEIVAGSSDGHVYVFEQLHIYDPNANTENMFELVWTSPGMFRVLALRVADVDRDYRPDIVVGGWDGKIHCFEYDNHSGYPFVEEHWITYREVWNSGDIIDDKIYSLETGDTNANGLPEIIVGTRSGRVYVFENGGITIWINDYPFPLVRDNNYRLNWTSENYTWTPIESMALGELDGTIGDEIAIVAQGQGVLTLDWNTARRTYDYKKVYKEYEPWETFGLWGLDYYVDRVIEANNVTYHDPINASLIVPEPINYTWNDALLKFLPDASVYPYNTGMAGAPDGNYSTFDASTPEIDNATAIVDFGLDEEGTGSASASADVIITFKNFVDVNISSKFNFSISQDGKAFEQVDPSKFTLFYNSILVDVDDALYRRRWDWFRYAKLSVFNSGVYEINSLQLMQVYNLLTDALSVTIGPLRLDGDKYYTRESELDKILVGTVVGELIAIEWDDGTDEYEILWQSGDDERYTLGANIWDIRHIRSTRGVPTWRHLSDPHPLWIPPWMPPPGGMNFSSWSFGTLDPWPWGSSKPNYFLATENGEIRAHTITGEWDLSIEPFLSFINDPLAYHRFFGQNHTSVEVAWILALNQYPTLAFGSFNPEANPYDISALDNRAAIKFYYRNDLASPFQNFIPLYELDLNGELTQQINFARATPRMDFLDIDGDLDLDFVVSNGYLYLARNTWVESEGAALNFALVRGYFDDINCLETSRIWGQPEMFDIDEDGDFDLILSYDNKNGATCFLNKGDNENPIWVEDRRIFSNLALFSNMKFLNLTGVRIIPNTDGYSYEAQASLWGYDIDTDYSMVSYNTFDQTLWFAEPVYDASDTYIVATYPRVVRLELSLINSTEYRNLGYHIHESWDNDDDLNNWTMCIASGDLDSDGRGEIIVGDYDNNVYAFEHLTNNTYKRMYRTFDLNHTIETDISPYYYEKLEGISGEFTRRIWHHAEHLIADTDLDQDGLKELVVAADCKVYIFEDKNLTGGDELEFAYEFDLNQMEVNKAKEWDYVTGITAIGAGNDIDYDGQNELVVAVGPFLFIFNVPLGAFEGLENSSSFATSMGIQGTYQLIGDPLDESIYEYAWISALALCDTDQDGYREIIIGGTNDTRYNKMDGFVHIYECQGGTFYKVWEAPEEVTYWNPISELLLDDQDYDGYQEIIIGHTHGFDMWEWIPGTDSQYRKVEYVTASPNYPKVPLNTMFLPVETYSYASRAESDLAIYPVPPWDNEVVIQTHTNNHRLHGKMYNPETGSWLPDIPWPIPYSLSSSYDTEVQPDMLFPSLGEPDDFYMTWQLKANNGTEDFWLLWWDNSTDPGTYRGPVRTITDPDHSREFPRIVELDANTLVWMYQRVLGGRGQIWCRMYNKDLSAASGFFPLVFKNDQHFDVHSFEAVRLPDGDFAIAFSARNDLLTKPDYDVYVVVGNSTFQFDESIPHQATNSYEDEMYPDIDYFRSDDKTLIVAYEVIGAPFEDSLGMVASDTKGATWSVPENLNTIPEYITRIEKPDGSVEYYNGQSLVWGPRSYSPAVVGLYESGFMYTNAFTATFPEIGNITTGFGVIYFHGILADLVYGINPQSDWAYNHLRNVIDLDVGDTDRDGRREVVVGFEDQVGIYELKHSNNETLPMRYEEAWLADPYENSVTGVTVHDSNGNVFEEIGISTERGEVYFIEYVSPEEGASELRFSEVLWNTTVSESGWYGIADSLVAYDLDNDTKDEIICAPYTDGIVFALDDDGSRLWNNTEPFEGINIILLEDLNNDTIPEVLCGSENESIYVIDIETGDTMWSYNITSGEVWAIAAGDLDGDNVPEVCVGTDDGEIWVFNSTGHWQYNSTPGSPNAIKSMVICNFTGSNVSDLVFTRSSFFVSCDLVIMNPLNGTVYKELLSVSLFFASVVAENLDDDELDEIVFGSFDLHILDYVNYTIYYNYTINDWIHHIFVYDFDGDSTLEILVHGWESIYMIDSLTGQLQWQYNPDLGMHFDIAIGNLGGHGELDVALISDEGVVVAVDGQNGIPLWFNITGGNLMSATVADVKGEGIGSIIAWADDSQSIIAASSFEPVEVPEVPAYVAHTEYWTMDIHANMDELWVRDLNNDGLDEIIVATGNYTLFAINATTMQTLWNVSYNLPPVHVEFGDLGGSGYLDLVVGFKSSLLLLVDGETGENFTSVIPSTGSKIRDHRTGEFDSSRPGDETVVLYEEGGSKGYLVCYDRGGNYIWTSAVNTTNVGNQIVVGHFSGQPTLDVAYGGYNAIVIVIKGTDGGFLWQVPTGGSIYGLEAGYINADAYEEVIFMDSSGNIVPWDYLSWMPFYVVSYNLADIKDFYVVDLIANDGMDDLIVNVFDVGIEAYNHTGDVDWFFDAPLQLNWRSTQVTFGDMDGDTHVDLVMANMNYLHVISGATGRVIWHYRGDNPHYSPHVGRFYDPTVPPGVVTGYGRRVVVIAGELNPPPVPIIPLAANLAALSLADTVLLATAAGVPLALVLVAIPLYIRRRRIRRK